MGVQSGPGRYVHYHISNYKKYGISQTTSLDAYKTYTSQTAVIKNKAQKITERVTDINKETLAQALMAMRTPNPKQDSAEAKAQENIMKYLENKFEDLQDVNMQTGQVSIKSDLQGKMIGQAQDSKNFEDLFQRTEQLEKILKKEVKNGTASKADLKIVKHLRQSYDDLNNHIDQYLKKYGFKSTNAYLFKRDLATKRRLLNQKIAEYAKYPATALQKGDFFEIAGEQLPLVCEDVVWAEVQGTIPEEMAVSQKDFKTESKIIQKIIGECVEKTTVSYGKIDVAIKMNTGKHAGLSMKNVDLNEYFVKLVNDSPMLFMLKDIDRDYFYHFLNLFAKHPSNNSSRLLTQKQDMINEIRLILFYKGLTGDVGRRKKVDFFVVNDNNTGNVKVYDIQNLIDRAAENPRRLTGVQVNNKSFGENFTLVNNWVGKAKEPNWESAQARVGNLLINLHQQKVKVSISTKLLK